MALTLLNLPRPVRQEATGTIGGYSLSDIEGMRNIFGGIVTQSGKFVSPARAMRAAFVLACIRILTEDIAALPVYLYRLTANGPEKAIDHPVHRIMDIAPNPIQTPMEMRERLMMDMLLYGNFYAMKYGESVIEAVYPLPAHGVIRRDGQLVWDFTDTATHITGTLGADTMWRGSILSANNFDGQAIILLAREAIGLLLAAEQQGARLFSHGIQSDLTLKTADTLDEEQKNNLIKAIQMSYGGSQNAFMPLLLEGGLEANRIGLTAQESQFMEARNFQGQDIARIFRIPAVLLGMVGDKSATYASAEQFFQSYTKHTLNPWATRIEQTIRRDLLNPQEQLTMYARHDFSSLLKADQLSRYQSYQIGISARFLSPNEVRVAEDKPKVEGLDTYEGGPAPATLPGGNNGGNGKKNPSNDGLAERVAHNILRREQKALTGASRYRDADHFYAQHAAFVEDLTGADIDSVLAYCTMRKETEDKFSNASHAKAISALIELCKRDV